MIAALLRRGAAHVAVEAVDAGVDRAADEPLGVRRLPVEHACPTGRDHSSSRGEAGPERFGIALGFGVDALVAHDGLRAESGGRRKRAVFAKEIVESRWLWVGHGAIRIAYRTLSSESSSQRARFAVFDPPSVVKRARTAAMRSAMRDGAEPQERAVVFDRGRRVAVLVGDDGEVVMRSGAAGIDASARAAADRARPRCGRPTAARAPG